MSSLPLLRQSAAELLALVVIDLFPGAQLVQSISTEFGFYCDVVASQPIDDYALPLLEERMRGLAKQDLEVRTLEMMREVAANFLEHKGQSFRAEAAREAKENILSLIQVGDFCDYCPEPYIARTQEVEYFKIFNIEKAVHYVPNHGFVDVKRIHGTVAPDKQSLKKIVKAWQSGKKSDHSKLSGERQLFSLHSDLSDVEWVWETEGVLLKNSLKMWWEAEHRRQDFKLISTPSFIKKNVMEKIEPVGSHSVTTEIDGISYVCVSSAAPAHMVLFNEKPRSFREMPIRYGECAPLIYRENTESLWGVFDSRFVSADFAHIFCAPEHLEGELISSLQFIDRTIKIFGFEYYWYFKGRGQKFAGTANRWEKAMNSFDSAFKKCGFTYDSNEQDGAFAGPAAEARLMDRFGREWKGPVVSLDFNGPERLGLRYQGADGKTQAPLVIARSIFGSLERFTALLLEHKCGEWPVGLHPRKEL